MKLQRKFFIISMETQRRRRALVIGYYLFLVAFGIILVAVRGPAHYDRLLPLTFYLANLLGGLSFSGPVRIFSEWQRRFKDGSFWGIDPKRSRSYLSGKLTIGIAETRLDEHDIVARDRAHYLAYSALRWPAIAAALFGGFFLIDSSPEKVAHVLLIVSVPVAALFFSLPQAILLWTEPDLEPDPEGAARTTAMPDAASGAHHA